jgi:hypothetical protein
MDPSLWGNCGWKFIHSVTLAYPVDPTDKEMEKYYNFFTSLSNILPCGMCRNNYNNHLKKLPLTKNVLSCRNNLIRWGIDLHNVVNYQTGKKMLSYKEALQEINNSYSPKNNYVTYFGIVFIVCVLIYWYWKYK